MKFKTNAITRTKEILANDHYVGIPYNCEALAADGIGRDALVKTCIKKSKLPAAPAGTVQLPMIMFMD